MGTLENGKTSMKKKKFLAFILVCFGCSLFSFGLIETTKLPILVKNRNNQNKLFVSDSAETSFGSIFGCFESKLGSLDTLVYTELGTSSFFQVRSPLNFFSWITFAQVLIFCISMFPSPILYLLLDLLGWPTVN